LRRPRENTAQLWDELWATQTADEDDLIALATERAGARFQRIARHVTEHFGGFEGLDAIEIGAGAGTNAALFAALGANVTILDYSEKALERSRVFFERNGVAARAICGDALDLRADLRERFDVSMSFGLAEHFAGGRRTEIIRSHLDLLRPGGMTFVSVPNRANPPYRLYKLLAERSRRWKVGEEYPFSRAELEAICAALGVRVHSFFGDSLLTSMRFIDPVAAARVVLGRPAARRRAARLERGTFLDARFAYALVLCVVKN
jgi:2-polyprenyl-3-methyl-5-hydroxy-6-metoxy-1,4-benzoquinol methylase